mgnify:CR=1 FL=1
MFRAILEDRPTDFPEIMVDGYVGFLFRDKNGMPEVALHWEHRLKNAVNRYNSIFRVQLPKITPHICRHTYCSNQAKSRNESQNTAISDGTFRHWSDDEHIYASWPG